MDLVSFFSKAIVFLKQAISESSFAEKIQNWILYIVTFYNRIIWISDFINGASLSAANIQAGTIVKWPGKFIKPSSVASILSSQWWGDTDLVTIRSWFVISVQSWKVVNCNWNVPELACMCVTFQRNTVELCRFTLLLLLPEPHSAFPFLLSLTLSPPPTPECGY